VLKEVPEEAAEQAVAIATRGEVVASNGASVVVAARTLCLHSDTPGALDFARAVATRLREAGVAIRPL
jgi:UPF0271 protein